MLKLQIIFEVQALLESVWQEDAFLEPWRTDNFYKILGTLSKLWVIVKVRSFDWVSNSTTEFIGACKFNLQFQ